MAINLLGHKIKHGHSRTCRTECVALDEMVKQSESILDSWLDYKISY